MSDDEYYAGSPYDDFEDMLWDADPAPDLADDLAQHAAYSPVWQDDPTGELEAYHSDWEYYSDDYYDDDPSILRDNPVDGSPLQDKRVSNVQAHKRGRKRKYEETRQKLIADEHRFLAKTIQGTVWATDKSPKTRIFREGQQETVGLLVDWKEKFKLDNGQSRMFGEGQLKRDESWANDLSLVDMGLTQVRERAGAQKSMDNEADDEHVDEEEGEEEEEEEGEEEGEEEDEQDETPSLDMTQDSGKVETLLSEQQHGRSSTSTRRRNGHPQRQAQSPDHNGQQSTYSRTSVTELNDGSAPNKRRKFSEVALPSQNQEQHSAVASKENLLVAEASDEGADFGQIEEPDKMKCRQFAPTPDKSDASHPQRSSSGDGNIVKKRRLSSESDDTPEVPTREMGRRSKRVASERLQANRDSHGNGVMHPPVTRSTRLRKR